MKMSERIEYIKEHCQSKAASQIARELHVDVTYVKMVIEKFELQAYRSSWTENEDDVLREHYADSRWDTIHNLLPHRTKKAVVHRAEKLGLSRPGNHKWTDEENAMLEVWYPEGEWESILLLFPDRTKEAIKRQAYQLGLKRITAGSMWTDEEIQQLVQLWNIESWDEIKTALPGRSDEAIKSKARDIGLKPPTKRKANIKEVHHE